MQTTKKRKYGKFSEVGHTNESLVGGAEVQYILVAYTAKSRAQRKEK